MTAFEIEEVVDAGRPDETFPVMNELRTQLDLDMYRDLLARMQPEGYRLFVLRSEGTIHAVAGVALGTNLYFGRYLWVYDLITTGSSRSKGYGKALLDHLEELARSEGCDTIALASALQRKDAHRFYEEKAGFQKVSYTFRKDLKGKAFFEPKT